MQPRSKLLPIGLRWHRQPIIDHIDRAIWFLDVSKTHDQNTRKEAGKPVPLGRPLATAGRVAATSSRLDIDAPAVVNSATYGKPTPLVLLPPPRNDGVADALDKQNANQYHPGAKVTPVTEAP
jgi:hypothetical protein